jgi:hypothetical protein
MERQTLSPESKKFLGKKIKIKDPPSIEAKRVFLKIRINLFLSKNNN